MRLAIKVCGMPRKDFISTFQGSESDPSGLPAITRKKEYGPKLAAEKETFQRLQRRIAQVEEKSGLKPLARSRKSTAACPWAKPGRAAPRRKW